MSNGTPEGGAADLAHPYDVLLGRWSVGVALLVVLAASVGAWVYDPERIGLELCWLRAISGLPCPGCGLTRSVCHLARGEVGRALWFHPFGLVVLPFSVFAASSLLWPAALRQRVREAMDRRRARVETAYLVAVAAFLAYGVLRGLAVAAGARPGWG